MEKAVSLLIAKNGVPYANASISYGPAPDGIVSQAVTDSHGVARITVHDTLLVSIEGGSFSRVDQIGIDPHESAEITTLALTTVQLYFKDLSYYNSGQTMHIYGKLAGDRPWPFGTVTIGGTVSGSSDKADISPGSRTTNSNDGIFSFDIDGKNHQGSVRITLTGSAVSDWGTEYYSCTQNIYFNLPGVATPTPPPTPSPSPQPNKPRVSVSVNPASCDPGITVSVSGQVTDESNNNATVGGATVEVKVQNNYAVVYSGSTTSNGNGNYNVQINTAGFSSGSYTVIARAIKDGYAGDGAADLTIRGHSSETPTPNPRPETRQLSITPTNVYRTEYMTGQTYYIDGYVTEKTASGTSLDSVNTRVEFTLKKGGNTIKQGINNDLAPGFRFSYQIPANEQPSSYTVELKATKSPVGTITYTSGTMTTAFTVVKRPQIDSVELRGSLSQYKDNIVYRRGDTAYAIIWLDPGSLNEPFNAGKYTAEITTTPAISPQNIYFTGWITRGSNFGLSEQKGLVYRINLPKDASIGNYQIKAKANYYLGEIYSFPSSEKDGQAYVIFDSDSKQAQYVYDPASWYDSSAIYYVSDETPHGALTLGGSYSDYGLVIPYSKYNFEKAIGAVHRTASGLSAVEKIKAQVHGSNSGSSLYYATLMVEQLRSSGLPARIVTFDANEVKSGMKNYYVTEVYVDNTWYVVDAQKNIGPSTRAAFVTSDVRYARGTNDEVYSVNQIN